MDLLASHYNLNQTNDWSRISLSLIRNKGGAVSLCLKYLKLTKGLLKKYNNSIYSILTSVYPDQNWRVIDPRSLVHNVSQAHNIILNFTSKYKATT